MSDIPLPPQPALLRDFPTTWLQPDVRLIRIHLAHREPNWFATDPRLGRFNPPAGDDRFGTCYVSTSESGAFVEAFGRDAPIDETDVLQRSISLLSVRHPIQLADLTAPTVRGRFGLTGEISAGGTASWPRCQAWAAALFGAGYGGVRYLCRHAPGLDETCFAIFGGPGVEEKVFDTPSTWPVPMAWLEHWAAHYGFTILPHTEVL